MREAVSRVLWIFDAVSGFSGVWRFAVAASFWRLLNRSTSNSRRTDGGGMLVGRTVGGDVGVEEMKLRDGGLVVEGRDVGLGVGLGVGFAGAGAALGPSVKSPQSSVSSQAGCGEVGFLGC